MPIPKKEGIEIRGAREHNLKSINVFIPRNKITVFTGLSGSGKSSLAFDTIYAEGQRRYIESLSTYARHFMEKLKPPDLDSIIGLSPVVAIDQKTIQSNPRSTIGTVTQVYDYLRLLYAKLGTPYCPEHRIPLKSTSEKKIVQTILKKYKKDQLIKIFSPVIQGKKVSIKVQAQKFLSMGYSKAQINGKLYDLRLAPQFSNKKSVYIHLLVDQFYAEQKFQERFLKNVSLASQLSNGFIKIEVFQVQKLISSQTYSTKTSCPECFFSPPELEPKLFSFNSPQGACPQCNGLGYVNEEECLEEDESSLVVCSACQAQKLKPSALCIFLGGQNISQVSRMDLESLEIFLKKLKFPNRYQLIADSILKKILDDIHLLQKVGVPYLSLNRSTRSLSGGEAQRIRLASQISSSLRGILYILDEPSIGLHPIDSHLLLELIQKIRDKENTVIIVEHDEKTIRTADHIIEIGPRAGKEGGALIAQGHLQDILENKKSLTGDYLSGRKYIEIPQKRRIQNEGNIELIGASGNNLKNVHLKIPLKKFVCITGVSGSGKSSLIVHTLYKAFHRALFKIQTHPLKYKSLLGVNEIKKIIMVDQKPIGKNSRSIPATYVGVFNLIRNFMSYLPESKLRGFTSSYFSFNVKGGRCDYCHGMGEIIQEMHFLSDAVIPCEICQCSRYSPEVLGIRYKDKNISDILNMTVKEAVVFFQNHPQIYRYLKSLEDVGLSYLTLGQSSATLSGGEAQRIKLTKELSKKHQGGTLYILDEPTRGLHFEDIKKLIDALSQLVEKGNSLIVIEHNMDIVKCCDYVVDIGPRGGKKGGRIMAQGTPEEVAQMKQSLTSPYLKEALKKSKINSKTNPKKGSSY